MSDGESSKGLIGSSSEENSSTAHEDSKSTDELPPVRLLIVPMTAMFQGYATYIVMQHFLKSEMGADGSPLFTQATVFMHYGKLFARVGHDAVCACFNTWSRVLTSMIIVLVGVMIPPIFVYALGIHWIGLAFIHFFLIGIGVGVFEGVFLSVISPLGELTKFWAILGAPLGIALVDIGGLFCTAAGMPPVFIYAYVVVCIPLGMWIFYQYAPRPTANVHKQANFVNALRNSKGWLLGMLPFFIAKFVGSFVMENTPGWFYVFNDPDGVPIWGPNSKTLMNHDLYFALVYISVFLGDGLSRRLPYVVPLDTLRSYMVMLGLALLSSLLGFYLESFIIAMVTLGAAFIAFWGNGLGYAVTTKYIDIYIPQEYNRAVYSLWCMVGDAGGILGASMVDVVNGFFCTRHYSHECL